MFRLASPEDQEPPPGSSEEPRNPAQTVEQIPSSHLTPNPAPRVPSPKDTPVQPANDMQVDQVNTAPLVDPPEDEVPTKPAPIVYSAPSTTKIGERSPPVSAPSQLPSWDPIGFLGDEDEEEEEEIPSINMDSDSD
jgi:hypothetical protein